jgi:hypothetical protein
MDIHIQRLHGCIYERRHDLVELGDIDVDFGGVGRGDGEGGGDWEGLRACNINTKYCHNVNYEHSNVIIFILSIFFTLAINEGKY